MTVTYSCPGCGNELPMSAATKKLVEAGEVVVCTCQTPITSPSTQVPMAVAK